MDTDTTLLLRRADGSLTPLATLCRAETFGRRLRGWIGHRPQTDVGLYFPGCKAIHTGFMGFPLDLIWVDRQLRVRKITRSLPPWRGDGALLAAGVIELPAGSRAAGLLNINDLLELQGCQPEFDLPPYC